VAAAAGRPPSRAASPSSIRERPPAWLRVAGGLAMAAGLVAEAAVGGGAEAGTAGEEQPARRSARASTGSQRLKGIFTAVREGTCREDPNQAPAFGGSGARNEVVDGTAEAVTRLAGTYSGLAPSWPYAPVQAASCQLISATGVPGATSSGGGAARACGCPRSRPSSGVIDGSGCSERSRRGLAAEGSDHEDPSPLHFLG